MEVELKRFIRRNLKEISRNKFSILKTARLFTQGDKKYALFFEQECFEVDDILYRYLALLKLDLLADESFKKHIFSNNDESSLMKVLDSIISAIGESYENQFSYDSKE